MDVMHKTRPYRGLLYKEWIKLRYLGLVPFALLLIGLGEAFYSMSGHYQASGGASLWTQVLFRNKMFFDRMQYLPAFAGIWLAGAQFAPEFLNKRQRLFFHLPVNEHKALALMFTVGFALLALLTGIFCVAQAWTVRQFMPVETARMTVLTILPLCLAGFVAYVATALVLIEQRPWRRGWFGVVGYVFVMGLCGLSSYGRYIDNLPVFAALAVLLVLGIPGVLDRIKRGLPW